MSSGEHHLLKNLFPFILAVCTIFTNEISKSYFWKALLAVEILKIVISGAYSAGKSQFIRTISEIDALETEANVSQNEEMELKNHTTVALDFGTLAINEELSLYLFGTPGQERFDFMWEILGQGAIGYVIMVDSTRPAHLKETVKIIEHFSQQLPHVPFVVAANKQDDPNCLPADYIHHRLGLPENVLVLPCVATERESVKQVLLSLVGIVDQLMENEVA